jgi:hypothetical protein
MSKKSKTYQIKLNTKLAKKLRDTINDRVFISMNVKGKKGWNLTCAIMDRLDITIRYLNSLKLEKNSDTVLFENFMFHASVLLDCIEQMAKIYSVSLAEENEDCSVFHKLGFNGKGTDKKYFEYLRSLCAVHPIATDRHQEYMTGKYECSPSMTWHHWSFDDAEGDIFAIVYAEDENDYVTKWLGIKISEVFQYIQNRFQLLNKITEGIQEYQKNFDRDFAQKQMSTENDFESYGDYLDYLQSVQLERTGDTLDYVYQYIKRLENFSVSNSTNAQLFDCYRNALKLAIQFQHNALQHMTYEGYENSGLQSHPENESGETLLGDLIFMSPARISISKGSQLHYYYEKLGYLRDASSGINSDNGGSYEQLQQVNASTDLQWARCCFRQSETQEYLSQYVHLDIDISDFECYVLAQLACYQDHLSHETELNAIIPKDSKYRL